MRIDVYLNKVCLAKSRTMAAEACTRGKILLNGAAVKPSHVVFPGDRIVMDLGTGPLDFEVAVIPEGNVPKVEAQTYYRILQDERGSKIFF